MKVICSVCKALIIRKSKGTADRLRDGRVCSQVCRSFFFNKKRYFLNVSRRGRPKGGKNGLKLDLSDLDSQVDQFHENEGNGPDISFLREIGAYNGRYPNV